MNRTGGNEKKLLINREMKSKDIKEQLACKGNKLENKESKRGIRKKTNINVEK